MTKIRVGYRLPRNTVGTSIAMIRIRGGTYLEGRLGLQAWLAPAVATNEATVQLAPPGPAPDPPAPAPAPSPGNSKVKQAKPGEADRFAPNFIADINALVAAGQPSGGGQTTTISTTITFMIKATGTVGPSFTMSRASGGSGGLFSLIRTDNNYVNIILTPTTYCPTQLDPKGKCPAASPQLKISMLAPQPPDIQAALNRIDAALISLNLAHLQTP